MIINIVLENQLAISRVHPREKSDAKKTVPKPISYQTDQSQTNFLIWLYEFQFLIGIFSSN